MSLCLAKRFRLVADKLSNLSTMDIGVKLDYEQIRPVRGILDIRCLVKCEI